MHREDFRNARVAASFRIDANDEIRRAARTRGRGPASDHMVGILRPDGRIRLTADFARQKWEPNSARRLPQRPLRCGRMEDQDERF